MKNLHFFALALAFVTVTSQARSLHPDTFKTEVAPVLSSVNIEEVGVAGEIVKSSHQHPFSDFLIAIPVKVQTGSACIDFVGQQTNVEKTGLQVLSAIGKTDPTIDACIEIFPMPVDTNLTVKMRVLTGGFVPANPVQSLIVQILPLGLYRLTLDMSNDTVKIDPLKAKKVTKLPRL
jgi:hypothetical protein